VTENNPARKLVDVQVSEAVAAAAKLRLEMLRAYEEQADGVATTTLAMVARKAVLEWAPPNKPPSKRTRKAATPTRPFRFHAPAKLYEDQKNAIHASGGSVAGVVQAALTRFAYTGKY
jgi:hypothetical protein